MIFYYFLFCFVVFAEAQLRLSNDNIQLPESLKRCAVKQVLFDGSSGSQLILQTQLPVVLIERPFQIDVMTNRLVQVAVKTTCSVDTEIYRLLNSTVKKALFIFRFVCCKYVFFKKKQFVVRKDDDTTTPVVEFAAEIPLDKANPFYIELENATSSDFRMYPYSASSSFVPSIARCLATGQKRPRLPDREGVSSGCDDGYSRSYYNVTGVAIGSTFAVLFCVCLIIGAVVCLMKNRKPQVSAMTLVMLLFAIAVVLGQSSSTTSTTTSITTTSSLTSSTSTATSTLTSSAPEVSTTGTLTSTTTLASSTGAESCVSYIEVSVIMPPLSKDETNYRCGVNDLYLTLNVSGSIWSLETVPDCRQ